MFWQNRKGFSLFELLFVIIIIAILSSVAGRIYGRVIERTRLAEADVIIGSAVMAQERYFVRQGRYTTHWHALDTAPAPVQLSRENNPYSDGLENTVYYTNANAEDPDAEPGFAISFQTDANGRWFTVAQRIGKGIYSYEIVRPMDMDLSVCVPSENNKQDRIICANYMGAENPSALPTDPRVPELPDEQ